MYRSSLNLEPLKSASQIIHSHGPLILLDPPIPRRRCSGARTRARPIRSWVLLGCRIGVSGVSAVTKTEVGYSQGHIHDPSYDDVCSGTTHHSEVVRVQYDPKECSYETLLDVFWSRHDPTTFNRQGNDVGTQYRSGIYFYTPEQENAALASKDRQQTLLNRNIVTEILPAKKFYRAEEYHQQYLKKGGQSSDKGCNDPIQCYG